MSAKQVAFLRPRSVADAVAELCADGAHALAGGTALGLLIRQDLLEPAKLVWLNGIAELHGIESLPDGSLRLGALARLDDLASRVEVRSVAPAVAQAAALVGNPRIRAVATVGGALAHADPRQDLPPALMAVGAVAELAGADGRRTVAVRELPTGFMETVLASSELITAVTIPPSAQRRCVYLRYTPGSEADYPTVGVAASVVTDGKSVTDAAVVLGGVGPVPILVEGVVELLASGLDQRSIERVCRAAASAADPLDDNRGTARYKRAMVGVWTERALSACLRNLV